ncbi:MAG: Rieske 2Fe-2S domain-containing protein [Myxococcota bacterium]
MSHGYVPVQISLRKLFYDAVLIIGIVTYIFAFPAITNAVLTGPQAVTPRILEMRTFGTCGFVLLTLILSLGPLARLDRRFLPLVWNRRHFGVIFVGVVVYHAWKVLDYYHRYGNLETTQSIFTWDVTWTASSVPFPVLGMVALAIFAVMAATSHDFWQAALGPAVWKWLHMGVYVGYVLVVGHVVLGALQRESSPLAVGSVVASVGLVGGLHVLSALKGWSLDRRGIRLVDHDGHRWVAGPLATELLDGHPVPVNTPKGEVVALVRHGDKISAMHGVCAHQGGPLSEGRVIDGCLTCPWHGWQYLPDNGCSPPPFTEKLPTYRVALSSDGAVLVDPTPQPAGTAVEPVMLATGGAS